MAAKKYFNHVLSLNDKYQRAIFNLALIEIKNQEFSSASRLFDRIMEPFESFNNIGYVCMLNGQYDSADIYFRKAIKGSPYYYPEAQKNLEALQILRKQKTADSGIRTTVTPKKTTKKKAPPSCTDSCSKKQTFYCY